MSAQMPETPPMRNPRGPDHGRPSSIELQRPRAARGRVGREEFPRRRAAQVHDLPVHLDGQRRASRTNSLMSRPSSSFTRCTCSNISGGSEKVIVLDFLRGGTGALLGRCYVRLSYYPSSHVRLTRSRRGGHRLVARTATEGYAVPVLPSTGGSTRRCGAAPVPVALAARPPVPPARVCAPFHAQRRPGLVSPAQPLQQTPGRVLGMVVLVELGVLGQLVLLSCSAVEMNRWWHVIFDKVLSATPHSLSRQSTTRK